MLPATVSVIIPVYNGAKVLSDCLDSVFNQDVSLFEVIVVDNNSTDATKAIINTFQETHSNLKYVFESRTSRGASRNAGIFCAKGDIIVMTDADCVVPSNWISEIVRPITSGAEHVVVGSQYDIIETYWSRNMQKMLEYMTKRGMVQQKYTSTIDTKNFAIDTKLMKSLMFDASFKVLEDVEFMFRLRPYARFRYLENLKVGHRHTQSMISVIRSSFERSYWFMQIYHKFNGVYDAKHILIFKNMPLDSFIKSLFYFDVTAIREQGISHLLFFIVYDSVWKFGRVCGYFHVNTKAVKR